MNEPQGVPSPAVSVDDAPQGSGPGGVNVDTTSSLAAIAGRAYVIGVSVLVLAVVVQFLLAGLGIFADAQFLLWHAIGGAGVIFGLSLVLVGVGRLGRLPGRTLWLTAAVAGLVVVQSLLLSPYHMNATGPLRAVAGLHVVNALLIFWLVLRLLELALRRS
jgi:uncharacterized protein DUF6220